jgi:amino acid permease
MGHGAVLIAYIVAGITIYGVMQSFAELLATSAKSSFVSYSREFMGDTAATGIAWAYWTNWVVMFLPKHWHARVFMNYSLPCP